MEAEMDGIVWRVPVDRARGDGLVASAAAGQVDTGRITGTVTDNSNALLPGVTVSLSGDSLIGGVRTQTTDERRRLQLRSAAAGHVFRSSSS